MAGRYPRKSETMRINVDRTILRCVNVGKEELRREKLTEKEGSSLKGKA